MRFALLSEEKLIFSVFPVILRRSLLSLERQISIYSLVTALWGYSIAPHYLARSSQGVSSLAFEGQVMKRVLMGLAAMTIAVTTGEQAIEGF